MNRLPSFRTARSHVVRLSLIVALATAMVPLVPATPAVAASEWWVDDTGSNTNPGTEALPFRTITKAMNTASAGDTIWVKPGTYVLTSNISHKPGVWLESTDGADDTIIQGSGANTVISMMDPEVGSAVVGFTITNGSWTFGGGLNIYRLLSPAVPLTPGWPYIADNIIVDNHATSHQGGGIHFSSNGGRVFSPLVEGNDIRQNDAVAEGGGIYCTEDVNATIRDNQFRFNEASDGGGFCAEDNSTPKLIRNTFVSNKALGGDGGGVFLNLLGNDPVIRDNGLFGNRARDNGGGMAMIMCDPTIRGNELAANTTEFADGGGIYLEFGLGTASNNLIYNNTASPAGQGGAAFVRGPGGLDFTGDTVYGNSAGGWDGLYAHLGSFGDVSVRNSVVWGHSNQDVWGANMIAYSCIQDTTLVADNNTVGAGVISTNPDFIEPAVSKDFRLSVGSPCIDTAQASTAPGDDFYGTNRPQDGNQDGTSKPDMGFFERPPLEPGRLAGDDRYETAVTIAKSAFSSAETVVLASGENFPDALTASSLAGAHEAPLLLTRATSLSDVVLPALSDLGASKVVIIGGPAAVSSVVADALTTAGYEVQRIAGADRYATGAEVAREVEAVMGSHFNDGLLVARGDSFPDALALAPLAYDSVVPIVLTRPTDLPDASEDVITELGLSETVIAGGTAAVSAAVANEIAALTGGKGPIRLAGENRYDTAAVIAEWLESEVPGTFAYVGIARGDEFPDALAGGVVAGEHEGLIMLTRTGDLPTETRATLIENKDRVVEVDVFGGTAAVSEAVRSAIDTALGW